MDRSGRVLDRIEQAGGATAPALSLDGRRLAMGLRGDIWVLDLQRAVLSRATDGPTSDFSPSWLADSQRLVFHRTLFRDAKDAILSALMGSTAKETVLLEPARVRPARRAFPVRHPESGFTWREAALRRGCGRPALRRQRGGAPERSVAADPAQLAGATRSEGRSMKVPVAPPHVTLLAPSWRTRYGK